MPRFLARDGRFFDRSHGEDLKQHGGTKGGELNEKTFEFKQQKYAKSSDNYRRKRDFQLANNGNSHQVLIEAAGRWPSKPREIHKDVEITSNDLKRTSRHGTNGTSIKKGSHFPTFVSLFAQHSDFRSGVLWYLWDGLRWCISEAFPAFEIIHQMAVSKPLSTGCVWGIPTDMTPFIGIIRDNDDRCSQWIFQGPLFSLKPSWIPNMVYIT